MKTLELSLFAGSLAGVAILFFFLWRSARRSPSATLPTRMFAIRMTLGVVFLLLGVVGSVLPILQGWIFFLLAALLFFPNSRFAVKALEKAEPKLPRVVAFLRRFGIGNAGDRGEEAPH